MTISNWRVFELESGGLFATGAMRGLVADELMIVGVPSGMEPNGVRVWYLEEVQ